MNITSGNRSYSIETGDHIEIPAWNVTGMVLAIEPDDSGLGSDYSIRALVQEAPESTPRWYRLEPTEYKVVMFG